MLREKNTPRPEREQLCPCAYPSQQGAGSFTHSLPFHSPYSPGTRAPAPRWGAQEEKGPSPRRSNELEAGTPAPKCASQSL